mmetsp:Transcript_12318/g.41067  ORF Transcript_12318/g.41067 Transcript_12318/m.41067 type:complete len:213 (-) Transcript_12318:30-668(-)
MAAVASHVEGRDAVLALVRGAAVADEELYNVQVPLLAGEKKGRRALVVHRRDGHAVLQQRVADVEPPVLRRDGKGRVAVGVGLLQINHLRAQEFDNGHVPPIARDEDGRRAVVDRNLHVGAELREILYNLNVRVLHRRGERRAAVDDAVELELAVDVFGHDALDLAEVAIEAGSIKLQRLLVAPVQRAVALRHPAGAERPTTATDPTQATRR